jgi:hypothetical protein
MPTAAATTTPIKTDESWDLVMQPPVIVAGHINATRFRQGGYNNTVQMLDNGLSIPCLFFGMEWPYARSIWSNEQSYALDRYSRLPKRGFFTENTPFALSTSAGKHWRDPSAGKSGPMLPQPPAQAMHAKDDPPGTLRTVAGSIPCACAGETCSLQVRMQRLVDHAVAGRLLLTNFLRCAVKPQPPDRAWKVPADCRRRHGARAPVVQFLRGPIDRVLQVVQRLDRRGGGGTPHSLLRFAARPRRLAQMHPATG